MLNKAVKNAPLLLPVIAICIGYGIRNNQRVGALVGADQANESADFDQIASRLESCRSSSVGCKTVIATNIKIVRRTFDHVKEQDGKWYYDACRILRLSDQMADQRLAHDLAVLAASKGQPKALSVVAETEDRLLVEAGQPQRFGTVLVKDASTRRFATGKTDPDVSDTLRARMGVAPLSAAEVHANMLNRLGPVSGPSVFTATPG